MHYKTIKYVIKIQFIWEKFVFYHVQFIFKKTVNEVMYTNGIYKYIII